VSFYRYILKTKCDPNIISTTKLYSW